VAANRNFANKIWNAARFITHHLDKASAADRPDTITYSDADKWILTRLSQVTAAANRLMDNYQFGEAGRQVYDFLWGEFADWYVELAKVQLGEDRAAAWTTLSVLRRVMDDCLRLLHPYIPFVTEETWQQLRRAFIAADLGIAPEGGWEEALIIADWPAAGDAYPEAAEDFDNLKELVRGIRAARAENKVDPGKWITAVIAAGDKAEFYQRQRAVLAFLARLDEEELVIAETAEAPEQALTLTQGRVTCYLPLAGMVDLDQERQRLGSEIEELDGEIQRLTGLLNSQFSEKAPAHIVQKERDKLEQAQASRAELADRLANL
jgi:valyl-tRNA synthetase